MGRRLALLLLVTCLPLAFAQVCTGELRGALRASDASPGQVAATLLARAVQLVEPAFPGLRGGTGPVEGAGEAAAAVTYLHRRRLLPDGWTPVGHTPEHWAEMLARFASGYRVAAAEATGADTGAMLEEMALTLEAVARAVQPLPVFAVDDEGRLTFFSVIWNWTPYPRLLVFRPHEGVRLGDGGNPTEAAAPVLAAMGNCALRFDHFAYADEQVALPLFVEQGESTVRLLAGEPAVAGLPDRFGPAEAVDALTFRTAALDGVEVASVAIEGPAPGIGAVLMVLLRVRTNVSPEAALRALALP